MMRLCYVTKHFNRLSELLLTGLFEKIYDEGSILHPNTFGICQRNEVKYLCPDIESSHALLVVL